MYRTIFTRIYLDSRKISRARIFARMDSRQISSSLKKHWSSANFFANYPRQKKVPCVWSNMHIYCVVTSWGRITNLGCQRKKGSKVWSLLMELQIVYLFVWHYHNQQHSFLVRRSTTNLLNLESVMKKPIQKFKKHS